VKRKKKLLWQIYPPYMLVIVVALIGMTWIGTDFFKRIFHQQVAVDLRARSYLIGQLVRDDFLNRRENQLKARVREYSDTLFCRVTLILPDGLVIADSEEDPSGMDNHADRPEIITAMEGGYGVSKRFSFTLNQSMMYVAIPIKSGGKTICVVRSSMSIDDLNRILHSIYRRMIMAGLVLLVAAAIFNYLFSKRLHKPIETMIKGFELFGRGDLDHRVFIDHSDELDSLSRAMNEMAAELDDRIRAITKQRNELEAILSSMIEGVLVVNSQEYMIRCNQAAAQMFHISCEEIENRPIQEVIRHGQLLQFIQACFMSEEPQEEEFVFYDEDKWIQAHGTLLKDTDDKNMGVLIVLNDLTQMKKLQNIRKEFVANVSHELKTPITAIKGFVETLKDGAYQDKENALRFFNIINNHADRLNALIEDLLRLSSIEQISEEKSIELERSNIRDILEEAITVCSVKASKKKIKLELESPEDITASINAPLLLQAVLNLIDNAIKYSMDNSKVLIGCNKVKNQIQLFVQDRGAGIEKEHLPRLFERFYRVEKARSREMGGTGLGLAIVKHISQAHGGDVQVESTPGKGSVFTISLPSIENKSS